MPSPAATILTVLSLLIAGPAMGFDSAFDSAFDLEAHRGGRALLPENTLPAFANALSMGVDTLELDGGIIDGVGLLLGIRRSGLRAVGVRAGGADDGGQEDVVDIAPRILVVDPALEIVGIGDADHDGLEIKMAV